jgi:hypothetical protein
MEKVLVGCAALVLFVVIPYGLYLDYKKYTALLEQCLEDGRKEYECYALLKRHQASSSVTIIK